MFVMTRPQSRAELSTTFNRLNQLVDEAFRGWANEGDSLAGWIPPVDVIEDNEQVRVMAELPGVRPEDVKIHVENNVLTIRGEKNRETHSEQAQVQRFERSYGAFERAFTVPTTVEAERISAAYDNGVLTVTLPKAEKAKPRAIEIKVGASANGSQKQITK